MEGPTVPPRSFLAFVWSSLEEASNPGEDVGEMDSLRVADTTTVDVVDVGVDAENRGRPTEEVGAARVSEADAARTSAWIERELEEFAAGLRVHRNEVCRRVHALPRAGPAVEGLRASSR